MKYILLSVLFISATCGFSQSNKEAEKLLNKVRKNTESFATQKITFTNILDAPTGNTASPRNQRKSSGKALVKGKMFRIELDDMILLNDGKKSFIVYPSEEEINSLSDSEGTLNLTPSSILANYQKGFSYAMAGKETVKGKTIQYVRLKPKASAEVKEIIVGIDVVNSRLFSFKQFGQDGVITTFEVVTYEVNKAMKDELFSIQSPEFRAYELFEE